MVGSLKEVKENKSCGTISGLGHREQLLAQAQGQI